MCNTVRETFSKSERLQVRSALSSFFSAWRDLPASPSRITDSFTKGYWRFADKKEWQSIIPLPDRLPWKPMSSQKCSLRNMFNHTTQVRWYYNVIPSVCPLENSLFCWYFCFFRHFQVYFMCFIRSFVHGKHSVMSSPPVSCTCNGFSTMPAGWIKDIKKQKVSGCFRFIRKGKAFSGCASQTDPSVLSCSNYLILSHMEYPVIRGHSFRA